MKDFRRAKKLGNHGIYGYGLPGFRLPLQFCQA